MFGLSVSVEFYSSWDYRIKNGNNLTEKDFKDPDMGFGDGDTETDSESEEKKE